MSDYHFFKDGIRPVWEDEENKQGGKWIMRLKKGVADRYWEDLLLALIGDQFAEASEEVCGAVVSVRSGEDVFSIWTKNNGGRNVKIRETIKRVLSLPLDTSLQWRSHDESITQRNAADQARQDKTTSSQNERRRNTILSANANNDKDKRDIALALSVSTALEARDAELRTLFSTAQLWSTLSLTLTGYMALLVAPEPISKGVAAALTVLMWGYLGWEFFDLLRAYFQLWQEAAEASTFDELREAGVRFGKVIGPNSMRILLLLGTAAVGETAALLSRAPMLPGFAQASGYHQIIFEELDGATQNCRSVTECRAALTKVLQWLAREIATSGTELNGLVTREGPR